MGGEDWDLEAVVRRFCSPEPGMMATTMSDPFSSLASSVLMEECLDENDEIFMSFPDLMANQKIFEELEELCKPFFIDSQHQQHQQHQQQQSGKSLSSVSSVAEPSRRSKLPSSSSRSKRRKNQLKKVVREVPADGTAADDWAWRKYGQKPIKGSPFPRGYYRCSSCKGCPARKQVEKSQADPGILIVTYTAEHTHPVPTHRNSLAGTTRQKLPPPPPPTAAGDIVALSPTTPSKAATSMASDEEEEEEASMVEDALFVGLEDL